MIFYVNTTGSNTAPFDTEAKGAPNSTYIKEYCETNTISDIEIRYVSDGVEVIDETSATFPTDWVDKPWGAGWSVTSFKSCSNDPTIKPKLDFAELVFYVSSSDCETMTIENLDLISSNPIYTRGNFYITGCIHEVITGTPNIKINSANLGYTFNCSNNILKNSSSSAAYVITSIGAPTTINVDHCVFDVNHSSVGGSFDINYDPACTYNFTNNIFINNSTVDITHPLFSSISGHEDSSKFIFDNNIVNNFYLIEHQSATKSITTTNLYTNNPLFTDASNNDYRVKSYSKAVEINAGIEGLVEDVIRNTVTIGSNGDYATLHDYKVAGITNGDIIDIQEDIDDSSATTGFGNCEAITITSSASTKPTITVNPYSFYFGNVSGAPTGKTNEITIENLIIDGVSDGGLTGVYGLITFNTMELQSLNITNCTLKNNGIGDWQTIISFRPGGSTPKCFGDINIMQNMTMVNSSATTLFELMPGLHLNNEFNFVYNTTIVNFFDDGNSVAYFTRITDNETASYMNLEYNVLYYNKNNIIDVGVCFIVNTTNQTIGVFENNLIYVNGNDVEWDSSGVNESEDSFYQIDPEFKNPSESDYRIYPSSPCYDDTNGINGLNIGGLTLIAPLGVVTSSRKNSRFEKRRKRLMRALR